MPASIKRTMIRADDQEYVGSTPLQSQEQTDDSWDEEKCPNGVELVYLFSDRFRRVLRGQYFKDQSDDNECDSPNWDIYIETCFCQQDTGAGRKLELHHRQLAWVVKAPSKS